VPVAGHDERLARLDGVIIATWTFSVLPLVENSVWSAPTAPAKSSMAVGSTCQDWWRLSTPLFMPGSAANAASPVQAAASGVMAPVPARCAGMPKARSPRSWKARIASPIGAASGALRSLQMLMGAGASALATLLIDDANAATAMAFVMTAAALGAGLVYLVLLWWPERRSAETRGASP